MITILNRKEIISDLDHKAVYRVEDELKKNGICTYMTSKMSRIGQGGFETHMKVLHLYVAGRDYKKAMKIVESL